MQPGSLPPAECVMTRFPSSKPHSIGNYFKDYVVELERAANTVSPSAIEQAAAILHDCLERDGELFVCGNGGSAGGANHFVCDYGKGIRSDTALRPRVRSLSS